MRIGVISDTHGHLDPRVRELFQGVDHIFHAGDIGYASLVLDLEEIAPVTAVLGNNDDPGTEFREIEIVELGGRKFLLHHIVDPLQPSERLQQAFLHHAPDVVVFGHTHKTFHEVIEGRLYFNPGYAGKAREGAVRTVAVLSLEPSAIEVDYLEL
ncbi:MAG: metallophosphoesterase family protein [Verrucomicrobia bacterium]|nr:MAG: metallophosphoesterase family protein [Verrucomicrobiota bacterium]